MINQIYQLTEPKVFSVKYEDLSFGDKVIVRPEYMAVCHADQRYYLGRRSAQALRKKLPMALIHECFGRIVYDPEGKLQPGQGVVLIPNIPERTDGPIYENYAEGSYFLSSGYDGFMQEMVTMRADRVVPCTGVQPQIAAITEFVSVAVHAATRFDRVAHEVRERIGIWGDGSLAYVLANVLTALFPHCKITVIGHQERKLAQFSFVDQTIHAGDIPENFRVDHAFECCGGDGSYYAIQDIIRYIRPQGTVMLMGVTENEVPINTRMVLEKGMTVVGCSRSGRADFLKAISLMQEPHFQNRLKLVVYEDAPVRSVGDIHRVFRNDAAAVFKTVFKWEV